VPLSPARRLGANAMIVVNPRYIAPSLPEIAASPPGESPNEVSYPGPLFLLGKALNALFLDRIDNDIDRLKRLNEVLAAGERRYGPNFAAEIGERARVLEVAHIRASEDIGKLASEYVQSKEFAARSSGMVGRVLRRFGSWDGANEADLLSYVLFDGGFADRLIDLGYRDARAQHASLVRVVGHALRHRESEAPGPISKA
jgi:NTE family protein